MSGTQGMRWEGEELLARDSARAKVTGEITIRLLGSLNPGYQPDTLRAMVLGQRRFNASAHLGANARIGSVGHEGRLLMCRLVGTLPFSL